MEYSHHWFKGSSAMSGLKPGWYPKEVHLCESCGLELNELMRKWWNHEQKTEA